MDPTTSIRTLGVCHLAHERRHSTFLVASQARVGHYLAVRRLDTFERPVSAGDLHAIAYADLRPGQTLRIKTYSSRPPSAYAVTMMPTPPLISISAQTEA